MMVIVAGVMIGLCLAIMEGSVKKAQKHMKGQSIDKQPRVKVGDRVRIFESMSIHVQLDPSGVVVSTNSLGNMFEMKTGNSYRTITVAEMYGDRWEILRPTKEQAMTQRFMLGDKVILVSNKDHSGAADVFQEVGSKGVIVSKVSDHRFRVTFGSGSQLVDDYQMRHIDKKTLDNLFEGDVVVDKEDTDYIITVAHVLKPGLYVMSDNNEGALLYTATQLKNLNYVPQQDPEDDKTCLTVADVAKKLGLNPDKLHIVADKKAA